MNILIVDDDDDTRLLLETVLRSEGYHNIYLAESGQTGLDLLGIHADLPHSKPIEVDLILLDVVKPGLDGIQMCSLIREVDSCRDVPIIIVTSIREKAYLKMAFETGASDYITKPFDIVELVARIRSALRLKSEIDKRKNREAELVKVTHLLEKVVSRLNQISSTDGLTGVANRRSFDMTLSKEYQLINRLQHDNKAAPLSLIMLDVDQFKRYNDTYGHVEGDSCLKRVAQILTEQTKRPGDFAARYGGEEFAVLLPNTTLQEACLVAERIRIAVENVRIPHSQSTVSPYITVSLGVSAMIPTSSNPVDTLVAHADHALYQAKTNGRNRVEAYSLQAADLEGRHKHSEEA